MTVHRITQEVILCRFKNPESHKWMRQQRSLRSVVTLSAKFERKAWSGTDFKKFVPKFGYFNHTAQGCGIGQSGRY
jgi:hypothetical protein